MDILAVYNHPLETLGFLKKFLKVSREVEAKDLNGNESFDALILMGGPMGVYECDKYPFLIKEMKLLKKAYKENKRVLGFCLGSQLIAEALGGRVIKGPFGKETGIQRVILLDELKEYFGKEELTVFQWHSDTFSLPYEAKLLAYSNKYFQAFRINKLLGIQFHVEVNSEIVQDWINFYGGESKLINEVKKLEKEFEKNTEMIVKYWLEL
jgi:GMP synthase-like glutamine amidotransferase